MQRNQSEGVIISCDFCGTDWDQALPMIEGHHGSVICLQCLKSALKYAQPLDVDTKFACTLCLQEKPGSTRQWSPQPKPPRSNPLSAVCIDCIHQAARAYDKDPDVDWKWDKQAYPEN